MSEALKSEDEVRAGPEVAQAEVPAGSAAPEAPAAAAPPEAPAAAEPAAPAAEPAAPAAEPAAPAAEPAAAAQQTSGPRPAAPSEPAAAPAMPEVPPAPALSPSELPRRSQRPGALALLKLDRVDDDPSLKLRDEGDIDSLATSLAKLGQLFPVDLRLRPPDRFQIISGFRRIAALRLLKRERVLARVHTDLKDEDALRLALAEQLEHRGITREELIALRERLRSENRLTSQVAETLERAITPQDDSLAPEMVEGGEDEVDLDELAQDVIGRLAAVNQDLALIAELWSALDPGLREALLEQLTYPEQLGAYLRGL